MAVSFEGFPRTLQRSALRPGRWFVAADGARPILCLATEVEDLGERLAVVFNLPAVEQVEVTPVPISVLLDPFATVEDDVVFAPGQAEGLPMLVAPLRRTFRNGALLRLSNGDLGIGVVPKVSGDMVAVSLTSGLRSNGFDLVFERWSLSLRRGGAETRIGYHKPSHLYPERRRV
ncbi:hypothetical protein [Phenylobacterium sp.]|jgi:hypothetical protein|uniref:hypothetical protein n=1 Tax=Phenylobacterium sp. TaxID=1871053 RepID=UPI002E30990A|nr:hypothetical protein [Phenylobacterium sp.]HEX2559504.1 hypothetical protein [Phenylobacterium sp.]